MRFPVTVLTVAAFSSLPMFAHGALSCENGNKASLSGRVTTVNTSPTRQAGQICLTLTDAKGKEVYDQCGAIIGNVVSSDPQTGRSILNHTVMLSKNAAFTTQNDVAQIIGVAAVNQSGVPCAFNVVEKITKVDWSSGIVAAGAVDINARGTISSCPTNNMNNFALSGEVCLKKTENDDDDDHDD